MSLDLVGLLRLVHHVTGFLLRLPADQLAGIADGRIPLALGHASQPVQEPAVPAPAPRPDPVPQPSRRPKRLSAQSAVAETTTNGYVEIAEELRRQETTNDGLAYLDSVRLHGKKLRKPDLFAVGKALNLGMPSSLTVPQVRRTLVDQAIGARKKFEGLRP